MPAAGREAAHHLRIGAAPRVDRLVRVGHRDQVGPLGGQGLDQPRLDRVHVVELIHEHPAVDLGEAAAHARVLLDQPHGQDEQVGVVEGRHRALALGVAVRDRGQVVEPVAQARVALEHDVRERPLGLGREAGEAHDGRRLRQGRAALAVGEDGVARHGRELGLVLGVEDREGRGDADERPIAVQQPAADRVERARGDAAQVRAGKARGAVDHLARRAAREGDQHHRLGRRPRLHQVRERRDDRARLARARRGEDQGPAPRALDGRELLGVEHLAQARRDLAPAGGGPQPVDRAPRRIGRQGVARGAGVAGRLLRLDLR